MELDREAMRQRCEALQAEFFADRALVIAANRAPVTFEQAEDGTLEFQRGGGGLVTALTGLCRHTDDATWIACARTEADAAWRAGTSSPRRWHCRCGCSFSRRTRMPTKGTITSSPIPLLWFLQHSMWDVPRAPIIDRTTWQAWEDGYRAVNRQFAEAIAAAGPGHVPPHAGHAAGLSPLPGGPATCAQHCASARAPHDPALYSHPLARARILAHPAARHARRPS